MQIKGHECFLGDDGTLDTVIVIDGEEVRLADTSYARDPDTGEMTDQGFIEICEELIEDGYSKEVVIE